jgi:hypothetical protein
VCLIEFVSINITSSSIGVRFRSQNKTRNVVSSDLNRSKRNHHFTFTIVGGKLTWCCGKKVEVEIYVTLRLTVSQPVCLGIEYPCGTCDQILFPVGMLLSCIYWALRTRNHILLPHLRLPQPGRPGSRIYIPQEQGGPVIPPSTGFPLGRLLRLAGKWDKFIQYKTKYFQQFLLTSNSGTSSPLASDMEIDKVFKHVVTFIPEPCKIDFSRFSGYWRNLFNSI